MSHSPFNTDLTLRRCTGYPLCGCYVYAANGEEPLCAFHEQVGRIKALRWAATALLLGLSMIAYVIWNVSREGILK